jgi:hypothetical protein
MGGNIKTDLQEVIYEGMDWIELALNTDRLVNAGMNLWVPQNTGNFLTR